MKEKKLKIEVREMEIEDIPAIFALGEKLFTAEKWSNLYRTWDEYELLERYISDREFCFIAEDEQGKLVGFIVGSVIEKRRSAWIYGYINWIGVDIDCKNLGIGKKLLDKLTSVFIENGVRLMLMDTEAENSDALRFFRKNGFGNEVEHIYLFKNLTEYKRKKKK